MTRSRVRPCCRLPISMARIHPLTGPQRVNATRIIALGFAVLMAVGASALMADLAMDDGWQTWDHVRVTLIFLTTLWLAWGGAQSFLGVPRLPQLRRPARATGDARSVIAMPICAEDPVGVRARIEAMRASAARIGLGIDVAILSDTKGDMALRYEQRVLAPLLATEDDTGRIFYRNRPDGRGRKAGNIEDFVRRSGAAFDYAIILDADSLMQAETIEHLIARMEADPKLGLLQTLPKIIGARSVFGRAMQFASNFYAPVFARGLARLQGRTGPFWGHNAIVRVHALAECCGLPELSGPPPFGGTILSHDYVEAALLARGGWRVEMDPRIEGSFEEGPDNLLAHARRDRRWCQGNLQHARILGASGLAGWSRFTFVQGIASYLVSILWAGFLIASIVSAATAPPPDYFPDTHQLFPSFPDDGTREMIALLLGIGGLLLAPKLAILLEAIRYGRVTGFGGALRASASVLAETLLTSIIAPIMMLFQARAVLEVLSGRDNGWPATLRGEGRLPLATAVSGAGWISLVGAATTIAVFLVSPSLGPWTLPVTLPMFLAPLVIWMTSRDAVGPIFTTPIERGAPPVVEDFRSRLSVQGHDATGGGRYSDDIVRTDGAIVALACNSDHREDAT